jgi:hypothetical protein
MHRREFGTLLTRPAFQSADYGPLSGRDGARRENRLGRRAPRASASRRCRRLHVCREQQLKPGLRWVVAHHPDHARHGANRLMIVGVEDNPRVCVASAHAARGRPVPGACQCVAKWACPCICSYPSPTHQNSVDRDRTSPHEGEERLPARPTIIENHASTTVTQSVNLASGVSGSLLRMKTWCIKSPVAPL